MHFLPSAHKGGLKMSDRFEELQDEFERAWYSEYESDTTPRISNALRWYHDKYLAGKGTCETCKHGGDCEVQCAGQGYVNALLGFGKFGCIYHVEKEAK
jgi:hypothetical protein